MPKALLVVLRCVSALCSAGKPWLNAAGQRLLIDLKSIVNCVHDAYSPQVAKLGVGK